VTCECAGSQRSHHLLTDTPLSKQHKSTARRQAQNSTVRKQTRIAGMCSEIHKPSG
jgi:hypothetical protein